jgi:CheY-like chemotaxis protein
MSRILIADDEPAVLKKVSARLQKAGFTAETTSNDAEALARLREETLAEVTGMMLKTTA